MLTRINQLNMSSLEIKILGTGCAKCHSLEKVTREVVSEMNLDANIIKVEDIMEIMSFGVMATPALVVDGKVVVKGRVPSQAEIKQFLTQ